MEDDLIGAYRANYVTELDTGAKLEHVRSAIAARVKPSREVALVITKIDEAILWWKRACEMDSKS